MTSQRLPHALIARRLHILIVKIKYTVILVILNDLSFFKRKYKKYTAKLDLRLLKLKFSQI